MSDELSATVRQMADELSALSKRLAFAAKQVAKLNRESVVQTSRGRAMHDRNAAVVAAYHDGASTPTLAKQFAISVQRISQILHAAGVDPASILEQRQAARRAAREQAEQASRTRTCRVCHDQFIASNSRRNDCSEQCAEAWRLGRRYLDPAHYEQHRRWVHATGPPNRRYAYRDSAAVRALIAVGRGDVLPPERTKPPRRPICSATTSSGKPCTRRVPNGDDGPLCHIHRALLEGRSINGQRRAAS